MFIKYFYLCTKSKTTSIPNVFKNAFTVNSNKYNTKNANTTFYKPFFKTKCSQFSITF